MSGAISRRAINATRHLLEVETALAEYRDAVTRALASLADERDMPDVPPVLKTINALRAHAYDPSTGLLLRRAIKGSAALIREEG